MRFSTETRLSFLLCVPRKQLPVRLGLGVRLCIGLVACFCACSCTLMSQSPYLMQKTSIPRLESDRGLVVSRDGHVPYQRWRIPAWEDDMRYVWMVGDHDFRRSDRVEIILYFHGMHSKDYYRDFRKELKTLAEKRPNRPFLFVGFVDTPYVGPVSRGKGRWRSLVPHEDERPELLFSVINRIYKSFRSRFPNVRKDKTTIALAGFSGGGRVLNSVGNWLARSGKEDPYAEVLRSRLSKIVYFDCWFDKDVVETVPLLLKENPSMKIVGTVHMKKPLEHAAMLAGRYKMKARKKQNELIGLGGRLVIFRNGSHWDAMISRLAQAL